MDANIKELISNTFLFTIANLGSKFLVFLMVPFYTYVLTPQEYGVAGVVQTTSALLIPILTLKTQDAVLRFCFQKGVNRASLLSIGMTITIAGGLLCVLLTFLFRLCPLFEEVGNYMFFLPFLLFAHSLSLLFSFFARGIDRVRSSAISGVINTIAVVSFNLIFLLILHTGVKGYLLSYVIADLASAFYLFFSCGIKKYVKKGIDRPLTKEMLLFSVPLIPTSLSWWLLSSFNNYLTLSILGATAVGLYTASMRVPSILTTLSDIFSQAWLLSALKNYETEEGKRFIKSVHRKFFAILCFMTGGLILCTCPIAKILLSGEFFNSWRIIPLLFVSVFWGSLTGFYGSIFSAEKKTTIHFTSTIVGGIVSVVVVVVFLRRYGLMVIPIGTLMGYFTIWLIRKERLKKYINLGFSTIESIIKGGLLTIMAIFVIYELYWYAIALYLLLIISSGKSLISILLFGLKEARARAKV